MSSKTKEALDEAYEDVFFFIETLRQEIHAFADTGTDHDRMRALKAIDNMVRLTMTLRLEVEMK